MAKFLCVFGPNSLNAVKQLQDATLGLPSHVTSGLMEIPRILADHDRPYWYLDINGGKTDDFGWNKKTNCDFPRLPYRDPNRILNFIHSDEALSSDLYLELLDAVCVYASVHACDDDVIDLCFPLPKPKAPKRIPMSEFGSRIHPFFLR